LQLFHITETLKYMYLYSFHWLISYTCQTLFLWGKNISTTNSTVWENIQIYRRWTKRKKEQNYTKRGFKVCTVYTAFSKWLNFASLIVMNERNI
jgi:hypothetical protein